MSTQAIIDAIPGNEDWGVRVADALLSAAGMLRASDLHLLCQREVIHVQTRVNDAMVRLATVPAARRDLLVARLKVLARLPAFVKNEPQDGRIEWKSPDGILRTLRISFLPTLHGESVVVRFPEVAGTAMRLSELGASAAATAGFERLLTLGEGTILVTGPSGSGKTTTMYALLEELHHQRHDRIHTITIEDPIERELPFAAQVAVNEAQGMTFDKALRAALRHDPNVLMIGEVRDTETARICVQAGMTGHLVLSSLHAGRVTSVFTRLLSMAVPPYLVASSVAGAIAQRLLRKTDGSGRVAIFEVVVVDEPLRETILSQPTQDAVRTAVARVRASDLFAEADTLVREGVVAREELERLAAQEGGLRP